MSPTGMPCKQTMRIDLEPGFAQDGFELAGTSGQCIDDGGRLGPQLHADAMTGQSHFRMQRADLAQIHRGLDAPRISAA